MENVLQLVTNVLKTHINDFFLRNGDPEGATKPRVCMTLVLRALSS